MAVDDENEGDLAQLPRRPRPTTTRTDAHALQREATAVTRPLFTADESADEADSDEGDLFDGGAPTSDATEFNMTRPQHTVADADDDSAAVERTVVSLVLPDHLRDDHVDSADADDADEFEDGGPTQLIGGEGSAQAQAHESAVDERPRREPTQSHDVYATKPPAARPAWHVAAMAVVAVVLVAVFVVAIVAAFAVTPSPPR